MAPCADRAEWGSTDSAEYGHAVASSKRRPDKSKRYRENKARREARAARSAHAGEATAISRGEREPVAPKPKATATSGAKGKRPKRESPWKIPGQRAVVLAFLFTLVSAATLLLAPIQVERDIPASVGEDGTVTVDDPEFVDEEFSEDDVSDDGTVAVFVDGKLAEEESAGVVGMVLITPIVITGAAVWFTKRPQRSTAWTFAMIALAGYIFFLAGPYGIITLPSLVALSVGNFQSRRVDNKARMEEIKAQRAARADDEDEVIDVEAVEETDVDDDEIEDTDVEAVEHVEDEDAGR